MERLRRPANGTSTLERSAEYFRTIVSSGATHATLVILVGFWMVDVVLGRFAALPAEDLQTSFLPAAAAAHRPALAAVLIGLAIVFMIRFRSNVNLRWVDLELGARLRPFAGVLMAVIVWRLVTNARNFLFDEWYAIDRVLLMMLLVAAFFRPAVMILLVLEARLLQAPLRATSFISAGLEIDELALKILTVIVVATAVAIVSGTRRTDAALPVMVAAVAAQFFLPGRIKVRAGWVDNEISNLPLSGYDQGWMGAGDGAFNEWLADVFSTVEPMLVVATLVFEVGAIAMVLRRPLLASWLVSALAFHLMVFVSIGFVFFEFAVVEVGILLLIAGRTGKEWSLPSFAAGPAIIAAFAVLFGPVFFDPPELAWFDSPLVYAYEIDGIDSGGERRPLVAADFAPYDDVVAFGDLRLGPTTPIVSAYGAASRDSRQTVDMLSSLDDLTDAEGEMSEAARSERIVLLEQFLLSTARGRGLPGRLPGPPNHFQTNRTGTSYDFDVPLVRLEVERITTLRPGEQELVRREAVAVIDLQDGEPVVTWAR